MRTKVIKIRSSLWNYDEVFDMRSDCRKRVKELTPVAIKPCMRGLTVVYNYGYHKKHTVRG